MEHNRPRFKQEYWDTEEFWNKVENPKSQPHWRRPAPEAILDYLDQVGIRIHGHPIIWGTRRWHHPEWLMALAPENEQAILKVGSLILIITSTGKAEVRNITNLR